MRLSKFMIYLILFILCLGASSSAWAKMISGKITHVDATTRKLAIEGMDPASGELNSTEVWVNADAGFSGADSLTSLKKGDQIWVEASEDTEGNLRASRVTKS